MVAGATIQETTIVVERATWEDATIIHERTRIQGDRVKNGELECPLCEIVKPVAEYALYALPPGKKGYVQVYRCRECGHIFAPRGDTIDMKEE